MINLDEIKLVVYDFDDTLCIHEKHSDSEDEEHLYNITVLKEGSKAYTGSTNIQMKWFIDKCTKLGIRQGLISATRSYKHASAKCNWVSENYGINLEDFCVGNPRDKIEMLCSIKDAYNLEEYEILLVDDYWQNLEDAANKGFSCCTPMEIVNLWNKGFNH